MSKSRIIGLGVAFLLAASCGDSDASSQTNVAAPGPSAPLQAPGKSFAYNFDSNTVGRIPAKFHSALTGPGAQGDWSVKPDPTAPSQPNVLAQAFADKTRSRFPLAIADEGSFRDLDLSVKFKAISGEVDQAAGLVFRLIDANNYYVVRANALENNVVLYKVESGKRSDIDLKGEGDTYGKKASVPKLQWNTLRVVAVASLFEVYLNGEKLFEVEDSTFKEAGKAGLWTKADSVTHFDDLQVTAK